MTRYPHHLPVLAVGLLAFAVKGALAAPADGAPSASPDNDSASRAVAFPPAVVAEIAALLAARPAPAGSTQITAVPGVGGGPIPDSPGPGCGTPGTPLNVTFSVPAIPGDLVDVDLEMNFAPAHTFAGDIIAMLIAPNGAQHPLFGRVGALTATSCGDGSDLAGPYVFSDFASPPFGGLWQAAVNADGDNAIASGSYFTTNPGGAGATNPMPPTGFAAAFESLTPAQLQGTWTLRLTDGGASDTGALASATLRIHHSVGELPIYDNGPLATGALTDSGVTAPAGYQWSETQVDNDAPGVANTLAGIGSGVTATTVFRVADDFTVPPGQSWTLDRIQLFAYQSGYAGVPAPFDQVSLRIWDGVPDNPGSTLLCGDESTNAYLGASEIGVLRIFNTLVPPPGSTPGNTRRIWAMQVSVPAACSGEDYFGPGTYWLDWNSRIPGPTQHFTPLVTIPGARNRPGDNARQRGAAGWVDLVDEGSPTTLPSLPQDLPFKLYGIVTDDDRIFANGFELPL